MPLKFLKNDKFFLIQNLQYYPKTSKLKKKKSQYYYIALKLSLSHQKNLLNCCKDITCLSLYTYFPHWIDSNNKVIILFIYLWEIFPSW